MSSLFECETVVPSDVESTFSFFSDATNLERITPPWLRFRVRTPGPIAMKPGTRIDYTLTIHGFPVRWTSLISRWEPPSRFVDEQLRGPYREWVHEHTFEPVVGGTLVRDRVRYRVPGGAIVDRLFVAPDIRRIFDYRRKVLMQLLGSPGDSVHGPAPGRVHRRSRGERPG